MARVRRRAAIVCFAVLAMAAASCRKQRTTVLAHCEIPGRLGRLCFDHYNEVEIGKKTCDMRASDGSKWVAGSACDRTGAATGCSHFHGDHIEWMYPGPSETPKETIEYMTRLCNQPGDTLVPTDWQPH
jgi:hypothetical protein